jgi:hypothetical protein
VENFDDYLQDIQAKEESVRPDFAIAFWLNISKDYDIGAVTALKTSKVDLTTISSFAELAAHADQYNDVAWNAVILQQHKSTNGKLPSEDQADELATTFNDELKGKVLPVDGYPIFDFDGDIIVDIDIEW